MHAEQLLHLLPCYAQMYKVDASECGVLQQRYGFRTVPMFLMFFEGKLVAATNALHSSQDVQTAVADALVKGRKKQFMPEGFTMTGLNIGNSSLDFIKNDMRLVQ